jgi:hypothetical protein
MMHLSIRISIQSIFHSIITILSVSNAELAATSRVRIATNEFSILDNEIAKEIYFAIAKEPKEFDLIGQTYYKNDRYIYCIEEINRQYHCHFYFQNRKEGKLSSFETDSDYGKGDVIEAIYGKPILEKASIELIPYGLGIYFKNRAAKFFYNHLNGPSYVDKLGTKKIGKFITCVKYYENEIEKYQCGIALPINPHKWEKSLKPDIKV